jgi:alpha-tubulin suppressor-like RCC1 family protein
VSAGDAYTCGIATSGAAYCWGSNFHGELGDGTTTSRSSPTPIQGGLPFLHVSAGSGHTCGVLAGNAAYCWGSNFLGELGDSTTDQRLVPTPVTGGLSFVQVSIGDLAHTCGVTTDHAAYCWGNNTTGQLGDGSGNHWFTPTLVAGTLAFVQVSAGSEHSCGVTTDNTVLCWGANSDGQLGDGTTDVRITPTPVAGSATLVNVSAGAYRHTCGVSTDDAVYCWGFGAFGQLGHGTTGQRLEPTLVAGGLAFVQVSGGKYHTCGVTTGRVAYCWGLNSNGQIGDGTAEQRVAPTLVVQ